MGPAQTGPGVGQHPTALTHDGVLGLEQGSPLAQPHGAAHLSRVVFRHVYNLEMLENKRELPNAASGRRHTSAVPACLLTHVLSPKEISPDTH